MNSSFTFVAFNFEGKAFLQETIYSNTKGGIEDIAAGQIDADTIEKVIEVDLKLGTSRDVTQLAALEVWRIFDAKGEFAWKEMREWLEGHNLDCDHLAG